MASTLITLEDIARQVCAQHSLEFVKSVGSGAFKESFLVRKSHEQLALKVLNLSGVSDRTEREIEAMKKCAHPNIVKLLDFGTISESNSTYTFFIEQYLGGGTLSDLISGDNTIGLNEIRLIGKILASAIEHLAKNGLVHRDIKPENIMFMNDDINPILVDLGLVRHLSRSSLTKDWAMQGPGTPFFASPEQLNNDKHLIDWRSDQFSLGVVIAFCITKQHPYYRLGDNDNIITERVAKREDSSDIFIESMKQVNMEPIIKMVEPWPVKRFTEPSEIQEIWNI